MSDIKYCECNCGKIVKHRFANGHNSKIHHSNKLSREIRTCKCGCKKTFKVKVNSKRKFLNGHNSKFIFLSHKKTCGCFICRNRRNDPHEKNCACMSCRMKREEFRGEKHPFYGKKQTKKSRELMSENHVDFSGDKNPNWQDGISREGYSYKFNDNLKESIRKRDSYTCQNCGLSEEEHIVVWGEVLHVHHIDHDKENCDENNLITNCRSCNVKANFNRNHWKQYYISKLIEKGIIINGSN